MRLNKTLQRLKAERKEPEQKAKKGKALEKDFAMKWSTLILGLGDEVIASLCDLVLDSDWFDHDFLIPDSLKGRPKAVWVLSRNITFAQFLEKARDWIISLEEEKGKRDNLMINPMEFSRAVTDIRALWNKYLDPSKLNFKEVDFPSGF